MAAAPPYRDGDYCFCSSGINLIWIATRGCKKLSLKIATKGPDVRNYPMRIRTFGHFRRPIKINAAIRGHRSSRDFLSVVIARQNGSTMANMLTAASASRVSRDLVISVAECCKRGWGAVSDWQSQPGFAECLSFLEAKTGQILTFLQKRFLQHHMPEFLEKVQNSPPLEKDLVLLLALDEARKNPGWLDLLLAQLGVSDDPSRYYAPLFFLLKTCVEKIERHLGEAKVWPGAPVHPADDMKAEGISAFARGFETHLENIVRDRLAQKTIPKTAGLVRGVFRKEVRDVSHLELTGMRVFFGAVLGSGVGMAALVLTSLHPAFMLAGLFIGTLFGSLLRRSKKAKRLERILYELRSTLEKKQLPRLNEKKIDCFNIEFKSRGQDSAHEFVLSQLPPEKEVLREKVQALLKQSKYCFVGIVKKEFVENIPEQARIFFDAGTLRLYGIEIFGNRIYCDVDEELKSIFAQIKAQEIWAGK